MTTRLDRIALALLGSTAALTAVLYPRLPARIPVHFDWKGQPDAWMDKPVGAFLLLIVAALTWALVRYGAPLLPRSARGRLERSPISAAGLALVALFSGLQIVVLWASLHEGRAIGAPLGVMLALFWITLAQILPRVRRNPILGVRTAWTLTSDENWARTHRVAGLAMSVGGLVALIASLLDAFPVALAAIIGSALVPVVYSYLLAHRLPPEA